MKKLPYYSGVVGPIFTILFVYISALISPGFSWENNYLSDIGGGLFGTMPMILFNATLIIGGILNTIFTANLFKEFSGKRFLQISSVFFVVGTVCLALIGIFTENWPIPQDPIHSIVSEGFFLLVPVGMFLTGFYFAYKKKWIGVFNILMALFALASIYPLIIHEGKAIPEILEALFLSVWLLIFNLYITNSKKGSYFNAGSMSE